MPGTTSHGKVIRCVLWHARGAVLPGALVAALDRPQVQWKAWDSEYLALAETMRFHGDALTHDTVARVLVLVEPSRLHGARAVLDVLERYRPKAPLWVFEGGPTPSLAGVTIAEAVRRIASGSPGQGGTASGAKGGVAHGVATPAPTSVPVIRPAQADGVSPVPQVTTRRIGLVVPRPLSPRGPVKQAVPAPLRLAGTSHEAPADAATEPAKPEPASKPVPAVVPPPEDARPAATLLTEEEIEMLLSERPTNGKPGGNPTGRSQGGGHVR